MKQSDPKTRRMAPLKTPTDLDSQATKNLPAALNLLLGDVSWMREAHVVCEEHGDVATASLIEVWIDEAERLLHETSRKGDS